MARVSKLSANEWKLCRRLWENDERPGYAWLIRHMNLDISKVALSKRAKTEGWTKRADIEPRERETKSRTKEMVKNLANVIVDNANTANSTVMLSDADLDMDELLGMSDKYPVFCSLPYKEQIAAKLYVQTLNYSEVGRQMDLAKQTAHRLINKPEVQLAVRELMLDRLKRLEYGGDDVMARLIAITTADPGELSQYRRNCCRYCWSPDFSYQCTPAEYHRKMDKWQFEVNKAIKMDMEPPPEPRITEGDWYDKRQVPNPDCPECFGEGIGEVYLADTRYLTPQARAIFAGVSMDRFGAVDMKVTSADKSIEMLTRIFGLLQRDDENAGMGLLVGDELTDKFMERMRRAQERQKKIINERIEQGIIIDADDTNV